MRVAFILLSVVVHLSIFAWIEWMGSRHTPHAATVVSVVAPKPKPKPKEEEPKPEEEKPKPKPKPIVAPVVVPVPVVAPPAPVAPVPAAHAAPRLATGLTLGNGPSTGGVAVGGMSPAGSNEPASPHDDARPRPPPPPVEDKCDLPDTKPRPSGSVQVEYPDQARADGVEGRIQVRIHVGADGSVTSCEVISSIEPGLDAAVLAALKTWKFQPATHCGKAVPGDLLWAQRFELGD